MKLGTVEFAGMARPVALLDESRYLDLHWAAASGRLPSMPGSSAAGVERLTLTDFIELGAEALEAARTLAAGPLPPEAVIEAKDARLVAPIPRPRKNIFCVGRNYVDHIAEDNVSRDKATDIPKVPQFFTKPPTAVVGPDADILFDSAVIRRLDYEVELALVIGRSGKNIAAENAYDHIYGYTIVNDITARDLQARHDQWFKGKALDGSAPMGPWIVTADEIHDPHDLRITLSVNGDLRQNASTGQMIFDIPAIVSSLSHGLTLEPGDIVATGTPSGVGYAMNPRQWLVNGDRIICQIDHIGLLTNSIVEI